jgi:hypothetical protein
MLRTKLRRNHANANIFLIWSKAGHALLWLSWKNIPAKRENRHLLSTDFHTSTDWMYFENGWVNGNYSACPALLAGPKKDLEQFRARYGIE